jgi:hypothetical protein
MKHWFKASLFCLIFLSLKLLAVESLDSNVVLPPPSMNSKEISVFIDNACKYPIPLKEGDHILNKTNSARNPMCTICDNKGWVIKVSHLLKDNKVEGIQQILTSPKEVLPQSTTKVMWNKNTEILKKTSEVGPRETKGGYIPGYQICETYFLRNKTVEITATVYDASFRSEKKNFVLEGSFKEVNGVWVPE